MQTPINSYVNRVGGGLIPFLRTTFSLKEKCTRPINSYQHVESVYNRVNVTQRFVAEYIHSDISTSKGCSFNINSVHLVSTELKKFNLKKVSDKC